MRVLDLQRIVLTLMELPLKAINTIYWAIFIDSRRFFKQRIGVPQSGLDSLVAELGRDSLVPRLSTPHDRLSSRKRSGEADAAGGAVGASKRTKVQAFGAITNYHDALKSQWTSTTAKLGKDVMVNTVLKLVRKPTGAVYDVKSLRPLLGNSRVCVVGMVTGFCVKPGCDFDHEGTTSDSVAAAVCSIIKDGTKRAAKGKSSPKKAAKTP